MLKIWFKIIILNKHTTIVHIHYMESKCPARDATTQHDKVLAKGGCVHGEFG